MSSSPPRDLSAAANTVGPRIAAVGQAFPPHYYGQEELLDALESLWGNQFFNPQRLRRLHRNVLVGGRHLALPMERYAELETFGQANDAWIEVALEVGAAAVEDAVARAGLELADIGALLFVTVTGVATPSLDARLINRLGLSPHLTRLPIFGLGCVAGAAGIARATDLVRADPRKVAVLLSVELCSLTLQREDLEVANLIASGLFGDGAAAAVVVGAERAAELKGSGPPTAQPGTDPWPEILATRSVFYPDSEGVMGWDISERGFRVVLSPEVPTMARDHLCRDVDTFLADHGLSRGDIARWICHPGGPKVLEAMAEGLELPDGALDVTWKSLREVGNLSSSSVLLVLRETLENHRPPAGSYGLLLAMGPGFCSELVLLRW